MKKATWNSSTINNQYTRDSNIELLRIISMFMILNLHSFTSYDYYIKNDLFTVVDFYREAICISAVNLYILISGYYKIKWRKKSLFSFIFQVYFWVLGVHFFCLLVGCCTSSHIWYHLNCLSNSYWFVTAYLLLYLLSPLLNAFCEKATNMQFNTFLIFYFTIQLYLCANGNPIFGRGYGVLSFIGIYLLGAKVRMVNKRFKISKITLLIIITTSIIVLKMFWLRGTFGYTMLQVKQSFLGLAYNNTIIIFLSLLIFLFFLQIKIKSTIINTISKTVFAVYLLHMHPDLKEQFIYYTHVKLYEMPHVVHYTYILVISLGVFGTSFVFDNLRLSLFEKLYMYCSKYNVMKK